MLAGPGGGRAGNQPVARREPAMSFFALPAWQPPSGYRIPTWMRPPEAMVPGIVPVELLLARTRTHAVLITDLRAYPTGLEFVLTVRPRPGQPHQRRHDPDKDHHHHYIRYHDVRLELRFADGRTVSSDPRRWPRSFETQKPDPPLLYCQGGSGSERGWRSRHWLWGLPPHGPLAFVCTWPAGQIPASGVEIDARLVLEAAGRATALWPAG
jgi:hypothetical protein